MAKELFEATKADCDEFILTQRQKGYNLSNDEEGRTDSQSKPESSNSNGDIHDSTDDDYPLYIMYEPMEIVEFLKDCPRKLLNPSIKLYKCQSSKNKTFTPVHRLGSDKYGTI